MRQARRSLRVLVVEDNPINQRLVRAILEQRGHRPVAAGSGGEALAALAGEPVDVVLMDVEIGDMDGLQATAAIRAREDARGAHTPIVALTAHASEEDRRRCLAAGMDGYVAKPFSADLLIAAVEAAAGADQGPPPSSGVLPRDQLGALFVADAGELGAEIGAALARRDADAMARAAHRLRGTAGLFAAERARELAALLERLGREGELGEPAGRALVELKAEIARLGETLASGREPGQ
jgi:CheY-like chemotaxis protein/HPt (histidine-containing phosphotransfer) domain-containing protein